MKTLVRHSAVLALLGLILLPLSVAHASPPPDYEQWRRDHPRPAGKALANLNVGEPRTVRMIYFSPSDRPHRAAVVDSMKTMIRQIQTFYAEQMKAHGYGNKTFRIETDAQGEPLVHRFSGPDPHVIPETFDDDKNVYFVFADVGDIGYGGAIGTGRRNTKNGGVATVSKYGFNFGTSAHELGHAFGLHHDFRDNAYIMSYGWDSDRLSACAAEFLAVHPYFNPNSSIATSASVQPTIEFISSYLYPPGSASVPIRLKLGSSKGLHQAILQGRTRDTSSGTTNFGVQECRGFAGEKETVARFEYDLPSFSYFAEHPLGIDVVDGDGNVFGDGSSFTGYYFRLVERSPYMVATLRHRGEIADALSFSPDGSLLATASEDEILLWDVASRQQIAALQQDRVLSLSFSPDGSLLAGSFLWDVASRQQIAAFPGSWPSFSPDGSLLATASRDEILLWDVASRQQIAALQQGWARSLSFSPDGSLLATVLEDEILLWDVASRQQIAALQQGWARSLSFSPDGSLLATTSRDKILLWEGEILLWDVASRQQIAALQQDGVLSLSFSPNGSLLAVRSMTEISLWDVASRQQITTLYMPSTTYVFDSIAFSPDGSLLATPSAGDGAVWLWDMSKVAVAQTVHSLAKVSGDGQQGPANTRLAESFVVSALNQDGSPVAGVSVSFSVTAGGGLLSDTSDANSCTIGASTSSTTVTTDAEGQAATRLTLGSEPGTNTVSATVEGLESVTFTVTATEQAMPHSLTKVCGDDQEGTAITQLAEPLVVFVSDEDDAAMAGVFVSFAVTAGGGTLSDTTTITDANGRAATRLTLGIEAGINAVAATVEGLEPVTFTATAQESPFVSLFDALFGGGKRVALPDSPQLAQNAPNPFNSQTVLFYFLPAPGLARVEVFALTGQRVTVLQQGPQQAGYHRLHWDGRDDAGRPVASGMYLYRLVTNETVLTRKLVLLR